MNQSPESRKQFVEKKRVEFKQAVDSVNVKTNVLHEHIKAAMPTAEGVGAGLVSGFAADKTIDALDPDHKLSAVGDEALKGGLSGLGSAALLGKGGSAICAATIGGDFLLIHSLGFSLAERLGALCCRACDRVTLGTGLSITRSTRLSIAAAFCCAFPFKMFWTCVLGTRMVVGAGDVAGTGGGRLYTLSMILINCANFAGESDFNSSIAF